MDADVNEELAAAAVAYVEAPKRLHKAILTAADSGVRPAAITRAIGWVYTPDDVRRLVREARDAGLIRARPTVDAES